MIFIKGRDCAIEITKLSNRETRMATKEAPADLNTQPDHANKERAAVVIDLEGEDQDFKPKLKNASLLSFFNKHNKEAEANPEQNDNAARAMPQRNAARNPPPLRSPPANFRSQNKRALERARERDRAKKREQADRRWVRPACFLSLACALV